MARSSKGLPEPYQLRDGRWKVALQRGHGSREHRVRVYLSGSSAEEVRAKRDDWLRAQEEGQRPPDKRLTTGTWLLRWLDSLTLRDRTIESYRNVVELHVLPRIGGILLTQLGPLDIDEMLASMRKAGIHPPTRAYALRVLSIALNCAVKKKRLIPYNPADGADRPPVARRRPTALTPEQVGSLLDVVRGDRLEGLYILGIATALRRGELLALRWSDWDRSAQTLSVEATLLYRAGKGFERVAPKTAGSVRTIRLPVVAQAALTAHSKRQAVERLAAGRHWVDNDLIFTGERSGGGALAGATVVHLLHRKCDEAGIPRIRFHDLRHSAATFITDAVGIAQAKAVLGHSTLAMTERYVHQSATSQAAADAIDRVLAGSVDAAVDAIGHE